MCTTKTTKEGQCDEAVILRMAVVGSVWDEALILCGLSGLCGAILRFLTAMDNLKDQAINLYYPVLQLSIIAGSEA